MGYINFMETTKTPQKPQQIGVDMGKMKELYIAIQEVCNECMDYNQKVEKLPRCKNCKAVVRVNGKTVLVNPVTEQILAVVDDMEEKDLSLFSENSLNEYVQEELEGDEDYEN